jgi:transposase
MRIDTDLPEELASLKGVTVFTHGHLAAVAAYCRRLGLIELVNAFVPSQMKVMPGRLVQGMILNVLAGRSPLYRVMEFFQGQDVELLVGEGSAAEDFSDNNLSRMLDALYEAGPWKILTALGQRASSTFALDCRTVHYDTTSVSVWGEYRACEGELPVRGPRITYGHSKDLRPDLKQFMIEMVCAEGAVPIFGNTLDGNASDKTNNNKLLSNISAFMATHGLQPGGYIYVADCAMVTTENIQESVKHNTLFISRFPANYSECLRVIQQAVEIDQWSALGQLAEAVIPNARRACATYRAWESSVTIAEHTFRAIVIHSDAFDRRRQKKLQRMIADSQKELTSKLSRKIVEFACKEDADKAKLAMEAMASRFHSVKVVAGTKPRPKRGRPPKIQKPTSDSLHTLSWVADEKEITQERILAGCFVLLTNVPQSGEMALDARGILQTYKAQSGVECGFSFLKDPLIVNDLFLKTPRRIEALGMILMASLMIWRLIERSLRNHIANTRTPLPGWENKPTETPTAFMMSKKMANASMTIHTAGKRILLRKPAKEQLAYLEAMGLSAEVFTDLNYKCSPIIRRNPDSTG